MDLIDDPESDDPHARLSTSKVAVDQTIEREQVSREQSNVSVPPPSVPKKRAPPSSPRLCCSKVCAAQKQSLCRRRVTVLKEIGRDETEGPSACAVFHPCESHAEQLYTDAALLLDTSC